MAMIKGWLTHRKCHSKDHHFHIYRMKQPGRIVNATYKGMNPPPPRDDVAYILEGHWMQHPIYGTEFVIKKYRTEQVYQAVRKSSMKQISDMLYGPPTTN